MNLYHSLDLARHSFTPLTLKHIDNGLLLHATHPRTRRIHLLVFQFAVSENLRDCIRIKEPFKDQEQLEKFLKIGSYRVQSEQRIEAVFGFTRFLSGFYMLVVKRKELIGRLGSHNLFMIKELKIIKLFNVPSSKAEKAYFQRLKNFPANNCYFSYTYDLTRTLAVNSAQQAVSLLDQSFKIEAAPRYSFSSQNPSSFYNQIFQWNYIHSKQFSEIVEPQWIVGVVHGFCRQIQLPIPNINLKLILVARRCRHHAGTRYLRRGINSQGFVANFVETEQIIINCDKQFQASSFVQVRGSAPVFWFQIPSLLTPKPPIQIFYSDNYCQATIKHFRDLVSLYGQHIWCINLMKAHQPIPRQILLTQQYEQRMEYVRRRLKGGVTINYCQIDMKNSMKSNKELFVKRAQTIALYIVSKTGFFQVREVPSHKQKQSVIFQNGVIRSNCVDCLDRTNSFQLLIAESVLTAQIQSLQGRQIRLESQGYKQELTQFRKIYEQMGDLISIQYGSSEAHKQKVSQNKKGKLQFITSLTRHFNNNINDSDRQEEFDVFLGIYKPSNDGPRVLKYPIYHFPDKLFLAQCNEDWQERAVKHFKQMHKLDRLERHKVDSFSLQVCLQDKQLTQILDVELKQKIMLESRSEQMGMFIKKLQLLRKKHIFEQEQRSREKVPFEEAIKKVRLFRVKQQQSQQPPPLRTLPHKVQIQEHSHSDHRFKQLLRQQAMAHWKYPPYRNDTPTPQNHSKQPTVLALIKNSHLKARKEASMILQQFKRGVFLIFQFQQQNKERTVSEAKRKEEKTQKARECKGEVLKRMLNKTFMMGTGSLKVIM